MAAAKGRVPEERLRERVAGGGLEQPRNFFAALTKEPEGLVNIIAEVKKASPSAGVIRADFDPVAIARMYHAAGADALSVLTDEQYFGGKLEYIAAVKQAVPLPVFGRYCGRSACARGQTWVLRADATGGETHSRDLV